VSATLVHTTAAAVRPQGRVTERLRDNIATAIAGRNRSVADVAAEYAVSWPTAHKALVVECLDRAAGPRIPRTPATWRVVRKPGLVCAEPECSRRTFTSTAEQLPVRARCTTRLRMALLSAVIDAG
jgi:Helix-turn-helix domain of transposase family ISL3